MTDSDSWRSLLYSVRGACQIWATVSRGSLLAAMVDWNREAQARELSALLASAAELAAASGEAQTFPRRCLSSLHEILTGPARPAMVHGVSAAAVVAGRMQATGAWMGDVRVQVESAGETWGSLDHTIANLAERDGLSLAADDRDSKRRVYRVVGPINALDIEEHTTAPSPIRRVALCSPDVHGYEPLDVDGWIRLAVPRITSLPLDEIAEAALFTYG